MNTEVSNRSIYEGKSDIQTNKSVPLAPNSEISKNHLQSQKQFSNSVIEPDIETSYLTRANLSASQSNLQHSNTSTTQPTQSSLSKQFFKQIFLFINS